MNIVKRHARDFLKYNSGITEVRKFIKKVDERLWDYNVVSHKVIFLDYLVNEFRVALDKHSLKCNYRGNGQCPEEEMYEDILFFLQNRIEVLEIDLEANELSNSQRYNIQETLDKILNDINLLKTGQQITYDDLMQEFEELRDNMHLNKKNWRELFVGKLSEMVAAGVISETLSKSVVEIMKENIDQLIQQ